MDQTHIAARLVEIGIALSAETDLQQLLANIVDHGLDFTRSDAATLYIRKGDALEFTVSRNLTLEQRSDQPSPFRSFTLPITPASLAGYSALNREILVLADAYQIEPDRPYQFDPSFDQKVGYRSQSMLILPLLDPQQDLLGVLQLINHRDGEATAPYPAELMRPVEALAGQLAIALRNAMLVDKLAQSRHETVYRLCLAAEARDQETGNHLKRISHFARRLSQLQGSDSDYQQLIYSAAPMHDIGKIGIPDSILRKQDGLSTDERSVMDRHPQIGYDMLVGSDSELLQLGAEVALTHHERWDGSGYPARRAGEAIPLSGRITALADVFDALLSRRSYKSPWSQAEVVEYLEQQRGRHFDPALVDHLLSNIGEFIEIHATFPDEDPVALRSA
ncbi:MAG: HD domain-containing protein [Gammaproteobacteria bacterium]|nr:HD domain-containing protein [Gammaproteobacteria bacterium]